RTWPSPIRLPPRSTPLPYTTLFRSMCVITALTAQNTHGVSGVQAVSGNFVLAQLEAISTDIRIDAIKIGMLANSEVIHAVTSWLDRKSTRLNSSHVKISYAVFCLKK